MIRKRNNKKALYESIMRDVARTVKRHLNENLDESKIKNSIRFLINEYINIINKCEMPYFNEFFCGGLQVISCKSNDSYIDFIDIYDDNYKYVMEDAENLIINAPENINICFRLHQQVLKDSEPGEYNLDLKSMRKFMSFIKKRFNTKYGYIEYDNLMYFVYPFKCSFNIDDLDLAINTLLNVIKDYINFINKHWQKFFDEI